MINLNFNNESMKNVIEIEKEKKTKKTNNQHDRFVLVFLFCRHDVGDP